MGKFKSGSSFSRWKWLVTGNKNGTAVITVRTNNGKHAETTVEVQTSQQK